MAMQIKLIVVVVVVVVVFRMGFTRMFASLARAVYHEPLKSLFICQRFSLLHFPMRTKTIFDDIQANSVLDVPSTKPPLNSQRKRALEICNVSAVLEVSDKLIFIY